MDKLQALLHTVMQVMDRPNSGIVTCLTLADLSRMQAGSSPECGPLEAAPSTPKHPQTLPPAGKTKARRSVLKLKPFLRPVAVAAGILLVAMLALHGTSLKATDLSDVYERLAEVETMHLQRINPERSEILQEIWIGPNIRIYKNKGQYVIWDLAKKVQTIRDDAEGARHTISLDNDSVRKVSATLIGPMHVLPFTRLSETPPGATWYRVREHLAEPAVHNTDIYEMVWEDKHFGNAPVHRKWRGYLEPETKLPVRVEFYSKMESSDDYRLLQVFSIAYPDVVSGEELDSTNAF